MEIRIIGEASKQDVRLKNEPFTLYGRMVPSCIKGQWSYEIQLFPENEISEMCFPEEKYDYDAMKKDTVFVGAYDGGRCVGLALLQEHWSRYIYLYDLKVLRQYRHQGTGQLLMEKMREIALAKGYRGIYTVGQDNNLSACKFYIKCGFSIGGFDNRVYTGTSQEGNADILFYLDC